jgi:pyrroline-5-carboxylate reductase
MREVINALPNFILIINRGLFLVCVSSNLTKKSIPQLLPHLLFICELAHRPVAIATLVFGSGAGFNAVVPIFVGGMKPEEC